MGDIERKTETVNLRLSPRMKELLRTAAERVARPLPDVTGQSANVDDSLGTAGSSGRRVMSREFANIANRMSHANSVDDWKRLFGL